MKGKKRIELFDIVIGTILTVWAFIIVFPFFNVIAVALASEQEYLKTSYLIFPREPTLTNFRQILMDARIFMGYRTTMIFLLIGVPYNMVITTMTAFALSKDAFPGKKLFLYFIIFTMYFSGGIVPLYLHVMNLGLSNTIWSVILVYGCNTFYMIVMRSYFVSLPYEIQESAKIDGANEFRILLSIILPLARPILATILLFFTVDRWNEWFYSMIFIRNVQITPLQVVLRSIIIGAQFAQLGDGASSVLELQMQFVRGLRMAAVLVTMAPIMLVYPFVQKHFVKGIMIGAIKA